MEQNKPGYMRNLVELKVNFELFLPLLGFAAFSQIVQLHTVINSASPESARKRTWSRSALDFQKNKKNPNLSVTPHIGNPAKGWLGWGLPFPAKISQTGGANINGFVPETVLKGLPKSDWIILATQRGFSLFLVLLFSWQDPDLCEEQQKIHRNVNLAQTEIQRCLQPHWLPLVVLSLEEDRNEGMHLNLLQMNSGCPSHYPFFLINLLFDEVCWGFSLVTHQELTSTFLPEAREAQSVVWIISWDPGNAGSLPCSGTKVLSSSKPS